MKRLEGKVAIVTGAGAGIGRTIALRFASEGACVIAGSRGTNVEELNCCAQGEIVPFIVDVSDPDQVEEMHRECRNRYGRLDVLVNNAAIGGPSMKKVHEITIEEWNQVMDVNVRGMFVVLKHSAQLMLESGGGSVVMMASVGSFRASAGFAPYITSKGAALMLTRTAALDYATDNIRVNAVCPGVTQTPLVESAPPEVYRRITSRTPQGRLATPDDVAALSLFLASDEAAHITGASYIIDGGRCAG